MVLSLARVGGWLPLLVAASSLLVGCGASADSTCLEAKANMERCEQDTTHLECPSEGEADAFQSCIYPCAADVADCGEFADPASPYIRCVQACVLMFGEDLPQ